MSEHAIQYICGCLSGWAQVLTMQPFEIIKVRLANQSLKNPIYGGIMDCINQIYLKQGPMAFYKGTLSPLIGIGALVSLHFGTNELVKSLVSAFHHHHYHEQLPQPQPPLDSHHHVKNLDMRLVFLSGFFTGIPSALVVTPVDHTRIKMQTYNNTKYTSSIDVGTKIFKEYGIKGLYQGFYPTLLGEIISLGIYFGSYEAFIRQFKTTQHEDPPTKTLSFFAGGVAGCLSWLATYPLDYIKTIVQSDDPAQRKYPTATRAAMIKYQEEGLRTFAKGLGITMLRAFPVNGVGFVTFEYFRHIFNKMSKE